MSPSPAAVEIWTWSGCPSHERAKADLVAALDSLGLHDTPVGLRWVETEEEARERHFIGSPTIAVAGRDILPGQLQEPAALTCRVYHRRDGRVSPVPDPDDLREALQSALSDWS